MALTDATIAALTQHAREAAAKAYSPYSKFKVGAAVLTEDGQIFSGCNVENASYGLTICAERNAIFHAVVASVNSLGIKALLIYTPTATPTSPCGACRQVINEFGPDAEILSVCDGPDSIRKTLDELLPNAFGPKNLELD